MSLSKRRLWWGVTWSIGLIVVAMMLHLALEWRQALDNIAAMIVTPVTLPAPTISTSTVDLTPTPSPFSALSAPTVLPDSATESTAGHAVAGVSPSPSPQRPLPDSPLNVLLLGTDAQPDEGSVSRTDAVILIHLDRKNDRVSMLSIPRDLWVTYPGNGQGRVNAAYAVGEKKYGRGGGIALARATIEELLGLTIDHCAVVNFEGFRELINLMGGITIDVPTFIKDTKYPTENYGTMTVTFRAGRQHMDGDRALIYARTRHADSDFGRNQRQQQVLLAMFHRVQQLGLLRQLTSFDDYTGALREHVRTDMPRRTMLELAQWGRNLKQTDIHRYAIDSKVIYELKEPATFAVRPAELQRIVGQFTGTTRSVSGLIQSDD